MSEKIKHVQVKIPEALFTEVKLKLIEQGMGWQEFFISRLQNYVTVSRRQMKRLRRVIDE